MNEERTQKYAGFWKRAIALWIDIIIVSFIVFPLAIFIALCTTNTIVVEPPFDIFTKTEFYGETATTEHISDDGGKAITTTMFKKITVLNIWEYHYRVTETTEENKIITNNQANTTTETRSQLIDPSTQNAIYMTDSGDIEFFFIFIYWILFEASLWQASPGKMALKIKVINENQQRQTLFEAIGRNLLKLPSAFIFFIGFMMCGWTDKKQTLHDKLTNSFVINTNFKHHSE